MTIERWLKKNRNLVVLFIIITLVVLSNNTDEPLNEKKTMTSFSIPFTLIGIGLIILSFVLEVVPLFFIGLSILLIGISGFFITIPTIPIWGWIAGFLVLMMMIKGKKGG